MVEQEAVNFEVAGSSPAVGATDIIKNDLLSEIFFVWYDYVNLKYSINLSIL